MQHVRIAAVQPSDLRTIYRQGLPGASAGDERSSRTVFTINRTSKGILIDAERGTFRVKVTWLPTEAEIAEGYAIKPPEALGEVWTIGFRWEQLQHMSSIIIAPDIGEPVEVSISHGESRVHA